MSRYVTIGGFAVPEGFAVDKPRHGVVRDGRIEWLPEGEEPPPEESTGQSLVIKVDRETGTVTVDVGRVAR